MSSEESKAIIQRLSDQLWNKRNLAVIDELLAPDWIDHDAAPGLPPGPAGLKMLAASIQSAFSEATASIDQLIVEGDKVAWQWTYRGTHAGAFQGILPTGKRVALRGITIDRIANGKLVERWSVTDTLGFSRQLGAIPAPAAVPAEN